MTTVAIKVVLYVDGRRVVLKLDRDLATPLASILLEVLTQHGLSGNIHDWVIRFGGVWIEWDQTLGNLMKSVGSAKGLGLVPLEILPRGAIKDEVEGVAPESGYELTVEEPAKEEAAGDFTATETSPPTTLPPPSAPTVPGSAAKTLPQPPPPPSPAPAGRSTMQPAPAPPRPAAAPPSSGASFPTLSAPKLPPRDLVAAAPMAPPTPDGMRGRRLGSPAPTAVFRAQPPIVERRATVRYYSRMNPERMYPLLVVLTKQAVQEVVQKYVAQQESKGFQVALESVIEVEPVLPGCNCYPPKEYVPVKEGLVQAEFWIVPHVLGKLIKPRVVLRQDGKVLAEVTLEMKVVKQTLTVIMGLMSLVMPYVSMGLKKLQIDWQSQQEQGFPLYSWLASEVLARATPEVLGAVLLVLTFFLYLWLRPRKRNVFWDLAPAS